jgi:hypothetical protein
MDGVTVRVGDKFRHSKDKNHNIGGVGPESNSELFTEYVFMLCMKHVCMLTTITAKMCNEAHL